MRGRAVMLAAQSFVFVALTLSFGWWLVKPRANR